MLIALTNLGTRLAGLAFASPRSEEQSSFIILAAFLHTIEMCDAVGVLVRESCSAPAKPLARSMFEALLVMDYLTATDTERRTEAWWVAYWARGLRRIQAHDPRTKAGQEFLANVKNDKTLGGWGDQSLEHMDRFYGQVSQFLNREDIQDTVAEYEKTTTRRRRDVPWYAFRGGPGNIRQLAIHLRRASQYEVLYRDWSEVVHPEGLTRWVRTGSGSPPMVRSLRDPKDLAHVAFFAAAFISEAIDIVVRWFIPDRAHEDWIDADTKVAFERLRGWRD